MCTRVLQMVWLTALNIWDVTVHGLLYPLRVLRDAVTADATDAAPGEDAVTGGAADAAAGRGRDEAESAPQDAR